MIEEFINKTFKDVKGNEMYCLVNQDKTEPAIVSTDVFRTMDQIYQNQQAYLKEKKYDDVAMKTVSSPFERARLLRDKSYGQRLDLQDHENQILFEDEPIDVCF